MSIEDTDDDAIPRERTLLAYLDTLESRSEELKRRNASRSAAQTPEPFDLLVATDPDLVPEAGDLESSAPAKVVRYGAARLYDRQKEATNPTLEPIPDALPIPERAPVVESQTTNEVPVWVTRSRAQTAAPKKPVEKHALKPMKEVRIPLVVRPTSTRRGVSLRGWGLVALLLAGALIAFVFLR